MNGFDLRVQKCNYVLNWENVADWYASNLNSRNEDLPDSTKRPFRRHSRLINQDDPTVDVSEERNVRELNSLG